MNAPDRDSTSENAFDGASRRTDGQGRQRKLFGPTDTLTPTQNERLLKAIGIMRAAKAAIQAGYTPAEVEAMTWVVTVEPLDGASDDAD